MNIRSLEDTNIGVLFEAFQQAFYDYEVKLDETELLAMLKRRGFGPKLSFAAFNGKSIVW